MKKVKNQRWKLGKPIFKKPGKILNLLPTNIKKTVLMILKNGHFIPYFNQSRPNPNRIYRL